MRSQPEAEIVRLRANDVEVVKWTVYAAISWNSPAGLPPMEDAVEHPELTRYHRDCGQVGDFGVGPWKTMETRRSWCTISATPADFGFDGSMGVRYPHAVVTGDANTWDPGCSGPIAQPG